MTGPAQRHHLAAVMDFLVAHEPHVHYPANDRRTMQIHTITSMSTLDGLVLSAKGLTIDCSQAAQLVFHVAGLEDPNGLGYRRDGYTGTLLENPRLKHYVDPKGAAIGALVVFGPGTGQHVCLVRHGGADPVLFSHGQERGPLYIRLSEERKFHEPPVTFLSIAHLGVAA